MSRVPLEPALLLSLLGMKGGLLALQVLDDRVKSINEILIGNGVRKSSVALDLLVNLVAFFTHGSIRICAS